MASTAPAHLWRSDLLGVARSLDLPHGRVEYFERGAGPTLVFAHGWLANANLWRKIVDELASDFRCVVLDLPLGAHRIPMMPEADLNPTGCGALITGVLDALDLDDVTLIGNDSGGAYSQIATTAQAAEGRPNSGGHPVAGGPVCRDWVAADRPSRIARLVLNSCETPYDAFPPPPFDGLPTVARDPAALGQLFEALRDRAVRAAPVAFGLLIKHPIDDLVSDSYALPCLANADVLRDTAKVMSSAQSAPVHAAGARLIETFDRPVLFAWGPEDQVFPIAHARRYADALANAEVVPIPDAYSFTPEDQPVALADAIRRCCRSPLEPGPLPR